jgi:hypothetical protein
MVSCADGRAHAARPTVMNRLELLEQQLRALAKS